MTTILQVEDDPNDVFFLQKAFNKVGVANPVQVAADGQQAIDYLQGTGKFANRDQFPFPCLVLLDLKLPYVMGLEVLRLIRQESRLAVPIVMLTASAEEADITTAYRLGANAFLCKPSEAAKLQEMCKSIKDFWLTHNTWSQEALSEFPMEGVVSLAHSSTSDYAPKPAPVNGARRREWAHAAEAIK